MEVKKAINNLFKRNCQDLNRGQQHQLKDLLQTFSDVFAVRDEDCTHTNLVLHDTDTGEARPIRLSPRRLPLAKREAAQQKVEEMHQAGIIKPSNSAWATPAVLVCKKDGTWRFCVDYRCLNDVTRKDSYPLPRIDDALDYIAGSSWFSSLNWRSGYWQVELTPESHPKTAFSIGQGLWQFKVMPFGLWTLNGESPGRHTPKLLCGVPRWPPSPCCRIPGCAPEPPWCPPSHPPS